MRNPACGEEEPEDKGDGEGADGRGSYPPGWGVEVMGRPSGKVIKMVGMEMLQVAS